MFRVAARRLAQASPATRVNLALAALLLGYTWWRAASLSFTHDESLTYLLAIKPPLAELLRYDFERASNNHLLNSALAKLFDNISSGPFALRLPNLLAHVAFLAAALRLARRAGPGLAGVFAFMALTLHPFLLDFFSLCRGYGLACGFELLALLLFAEGADTATPRPTLSAAALALAGLCPLANFSFLVFYLAFAALVVGGDALKWLRAGARTSERRAAGKALLQTSSAALLVSAVACGTVVPIGLKLRKLGELYYGGSVGFLHDTLGSLLEADTYYVAYPSWMHWALVVLGLVLLASTLYGAARLARAGSATAALLSALPLLTALICVAQHHLLATKYPVDRTALFFLPMGALAVVSASAASGPRARGLLLGGVALLLTLNAARTLNLGYVAQWRYDADTADMLEQLARLNGHEPASGARSTDRAGDAPQLRLGANWLFEPTLNYYRELRGLSWLAPVERQDLLREDRDYYFFLPDDEPAMAPRPMERLHHYPRSQATLARSGAPRP